MAADGEVTFVGLPAGFGLLGDAISSIQSFVHVFILVYVLLIFVHILISWFQLPYRPWLYRIRQFLSDVCDPYLRLFRRVLPPLGPLDLSPIVAVFVLVILDYLLVGLLERLQ